MTATPDVAQHCLQPGDAFILLASDGLVRGQGSAEGRGGNCMHCGWTGLRGAKPGGAGLCDVFTFF